MAIVIRTLIDFLAAKDKKRLREVVPALTGFISSGLPKLTAASGKTPGAAGFREPEKLLQDIWGQVSSDSDGYLGKQDLLKEVKYIIEELNPLKQEKVASARAAMEKKAKLQNTMGNHNTGPDADEAAKARREVNLILLRNKGREPDQTNYEDYEKYNALLAKIKRMEMDRPTIFSDVDAVYAGMIKETTKLPAAAK